MNSKRQITSFDTVRARLQDDDAPDLLIRHMERAFTQLAEGATGFISESDIAPVSSLPALDELESYTPAGRAVLGQSVMIKLNGGLGTSMGLERAKSLLEVRDGMSFLDIILRQILHIRQANHALMPILFMNSFSTRTDTLEVLERYPELAEGQADVPFDFLQNRIPKLRQDTLEPVSYPDAPQQEWCPPGHGDIYLCLQTSGLLDQLLASGYQYAFISNADNLGATLDPRILGYLHEEQHPFLMEATARTAADRKGGHLASRADGGLLLRESAQCPPDAQEAFQDLERHRYFNTNNLWVNLGLLKEHLDAVHGILDLPLIVNKKTVNPRDLESTPVYQLETAMGSALSAIPQAVAIDVPRTRFAPVKTTDDLLALRSDLYAVTDAYHVVTNPKRTAALPNIVLDPKFFKMVADFEARFPQGAPSLLQCSDLVVKGDIHFGRNVICRGAVRVEANSEKQNVIPDDAMLQDTAGIMGIH